MNKGWYEVTYWEGRLSYRWISPNDTTVYMAPAVYECDTEDEAIQWISENSEYYWKRYWG